TGLGVAVDGVVGLGISVGLGRGGAAGVGGRVGVGQLGVGKGVTVGSASPAQALSRRIKKSKTRRFWAICALYQRLVMGDSRGLRRVWGAETSRAVSVSDKSPGFACPDPRAAL